jgi:AcrR family transcriptional regulator
MAPPKRDKIAKTHTKTTVSGRARAASTRDGSSGSKYDKPRKIRSDGLETRARVLAAATEVFARDGFEGTSLRQIAEVAGIDIATLKYHVGNKAALFTEVYQDGYEHFQQSLGPLLLRLPLARNPDELVVEVRALIERGYDYFEKNESFIRLWLFRLLEGPEEVLEAEETLRSNVMMLIEAAVGILRERGLVRPQLDVRVVALAVITALPMLALSTKARPGLLGQSELDPRERFITFFVELLGRLVLPDPTLDSK